MDLQSVVGSLNTDSMAILTVSGQFGSDQTSTKFYLMNFTATSGNEGRGGEGGGDGEEGGKGKGGGGRRKERGRE